MAAPRAASTPAAETSKVANAPFDLLVLLVLDAEAPLAVLEPEAAPAAEVKGSSAGVADAGGYVAPNALTSNCCETA